jgi:hypothetical protein
VDLSVSPDIDAYLCYGIVLLLGAFTAVVQINRRFNPLAGVWLIARTWVLFLLYLMVPVGLFWFLDRTGAVTDTSLFAAILIGVGYERIMNGANPAVRAAADLSQFWKPFQEYVNDVSLAVLTRSKRNEDRLVDRVVASIIEDNARYTALESLALRVSKDATALRAELAAIDATGASGVRKPHEVLEEKTRRLFTLRADVPDAYHLMWSRGIVSDKIYWLDVRGVRTILRHGFVVVVLLAALAALAWKIGPDPRQLTADYYIWRLVKTNATSVDQTRARAHLLALMHEHPRVVPAATARLARLLRQPGLAVERIDLILQTLLESRAVKDGNPSLPLQLVQSLRAASVDARARINDVLKHLADACAIKFTETNPWKPGDGDATTALEARVKAWADYWEKCAKGA